MADLVLQHISKYYIPGEAAVKDFNLRIVEGEFIVLVGPSGCGKSTLLRMIAGLEDISQGELLIGKKCINNVPAKDRNVAFVFQNYALYPHMNVYENLAFGLKNHRYSKDKIESRVKRAAQLLDLNNYLNRKPQALSGGQQQRVALGRAIVRDAKLFLMDEPLSNLDSKLRAQMRSEIIRIHQRLKTTTIYVTHDQTEAMTMGNRLVVMRDGVIQQVGSPEEIYDNPINTFVGSFIGSPGMNFLNGIFSDGKINFGDQSIIIPEVKSSALHRAGYQNKELIIGLRPESLYIEFSKRQNPNLSYIAAQTEISETLGQERLLHCYMNNQLLVARIWPPFGEISENITLSFDPNKLHYFDPFTEKQII